MKLVMRGASVEEREKMAATIAEALSNEMACGVPTISIKKGRVSRVIHRGGDRWIGDLKTGHWGPAKRLQIVV